MKTTIILNTKYGRLTPLKIIGKKDSHTVFECICNCGTLISVKGIYLKSGHTKSCGCLSKELLIKRNTLVKGQASFNCLFSRYKINAKIKNVSFNISKDCFKKLTKQNCYYCNRKPSKSITNSSVKCNGSYIYNGIDRVDNNLGYELTNVVPCCSICNYAKRNLTYADFISWIKRAYKNIVKR